MKKLIAILMVTVVCLANVSVAKVSATSVSSIDMWTKDPLDRVKDNEIKPNQGTTSFGLIMAKNESECYQIVLRSTQGFNIQNVLFEGFPSDITWKYNFIDYEDNTPRKDWTVVTTGPSTLYPYKNGIPDPLSNDTTRSVSANKTQPIFITATTKDTTNHGSFSGTIKIVTDKGQIPVSATVDVKNVTVPKIADSDFTVYNWSADLGYSFSPQWDALKLHYNNPARYSNEWWEIIGNMTDEMLRTRQNMVLVNTPQLLLDGGTTVDANGNVTFNWSRFDEFVNFYINKGFRRFGGMHLAFHWDGTQNYAGGRNAIGRLGYDSNTGKTIWTGGDIRGNDAKKWLEQYLPALATKLNSIDVPNTNKKLYDVWYQHIFDEPQYAPDGVNKWKYLTEKVRDLACIKDANNNIVKSLKTTDADSNGGMMAHADLVTTWCPSEEVYEHNKEFYDSQQQLNNMEKFIYICVVPAAPALNRFVSQPTFTSQLNYWYCYKNDVDVLLHWAWNVWGIGYMNGDSFIVYPDPVNKTVKSSLRAEAMRDGIEDVELFKIIESRDSDLAKRLVNTSIKNYKEYATDVAYIRNVRNLLVKAAAGESITIPDSIIPNKELIIPYNAQGVNNDNPDINYTGNWFRDANRKSHGWYNYKDDIHGATTDGDSFEYTFEGTGIDVITEKNTDVADLEIYIDGISQGVFNGYSNFRNGYITLFSKKGLSNGQHTVKGVVRNTTSERKYGIFDGFLIYDGKKPATEFINNTNKRIVYKDVFGRWKNSNRTMFGPKFVDAHIVNAVGATAELKFYGTGIEVITEKNSDQMSLKVFVDNVDKGVFSTYSSSREPQKVAFRIDGLNQGEHNIKLQTVKQSGEGEWMVIDGFNVLNTVLNVDSSATIINDSDSAITYTGNWIHDTLRKPYGFIDYNDDLHITLQNDQSFEYSFTGTGVEVFAEANSDTADFEIFIDGVSKGVYSATTQTRTPFHKMFSIRNLSQGQHTLKAVSKNIDSVKKYAVVDAIVIY